MFEKKKTENKGKMEAAKKSGTKTKQKKKDSLSVFKTLLLPLLFACIVVSAISFVTEQKVTQKEEMATVVSMKADLDKNTFVKEEEYKKYFAVVQVDKEIIPQNAYPTLKSLPKEGFYLKDAMKKSQMVLKEDLVENNVRLEKYQDGYVLTSFDTPAFASSVNGSLRRGDLVDVYALDEATRAYVLMASDVYIEDVYDTSGNKISDETSVATSFTVRVTAEEVPQINAAVSSGDILLYLKTDSCL